MFSKQSVVALLIAVAATTTTSSVSASLRGGVPTTTSNTVTTTGNHRILGQVMCPTDEPINGMDCSHNAGESCKYDNGVLNFRYSDTTCSCEKMVGTTENIYEWSCTPNNNEHSHQVMCPMDKPTSGDQCNSNKKETCTYDDSNTTCECVAMLGNTDDDYEWSCNDSCPTTFTDENGENPHECYHAGQSCVDNYCLTCTCEPLLGNTDGIMTWNCVENGNCHV